MALVEDVYNSVENPMAKMMRDAGYGEVPGIPRTVAPRVECDEAPSRWLPMRQLCDRHRREARLPNGVLLFDLAAQASKPLEGRGLGFVLNPVSVDGTRAWAAWVLSAWSVYEEIFPCDDYFEFEVQHRPELVDALFGLHRKRARFDGEVSAKQVAAYVVDVGWTAFRETQRLLDLWWCRDRYAKVLSSAGLVCAASADEAIELMRRVEPCVAPPEQFHEGIRQLLALARTRFALVDDA